MIKYSGNRAKQQLGTLSLHDFEGNFEHVAENIREVYENFRRDHIESARNVHESNYHGGYADGTRDKKVQFDKLYLDIDDEYGDKVVKIWGERDVTPEEKAALDVKNSEIMSKNEERERELLRTLKAKYD